MEETRTELQMIKMSEIQGSNMAVVSVYPIWKTDDCAGRSGRWQDNTGIEYSGKAIKGRGLRQ